jgi:hypothetical protein
VFLDGCVPGKLHPQSTQQEHRHLPFDKVGALQLHYDILEDIDDVFGVGGRLQIFVGLLGNLAEANPEVGCCQFGVGEGQCVVIFSPHQFQWVLLGSQLILRFHLQEPWGNFK